MSIVEKINWSLLLGIIAGLIVIAVAIAQWNEKKKEEEKSELSKIEAQKAQAELKSIQLENLNKTNELANAYKEIASLQNKLRNDITGGDSKPTLLLLTSREVLDNKSQKKYFILFFDILNNNKYALQNVSAVVRDTYGYEMLQYGVQHLREQKEHKYILKNLDFNPNKYFNEIGSITKGSRYPLYMTTYCPELQKDNDKPVFPVEISWYNGHFTYYIKLKVVDKSLELDSYEFVFNGKKSNSKKYLKFTKAS